MINLRPFDQMLEGVSCSIGGKQDHDDYSFEWFHTQDMSRVRVTRKLAASIASTLWIITVVLIMVGVFRACAQSLIMQSL